MAELVNMPKLGFDMAEGTLVRWVVGEGKSVEKGEVLAEIETDKATVEVEASASGVVHKHLVAEGTPVPVGDPIAIIGEAGETVDVSAMTGGKAPRKAEVQETEGAPAAQEAQSKPEPETPAPTPERQKVDGQFPGGVKASPVARRLAEEENIDLRRVTGSGPGGRIVKRDIEAAIQAPQVQPAPAPAFVGPDARPRETERADLTRLRIAIGRRMRASKQEAPHFYVTSEIDAGPMMALRAELSALLPEGAPKFSVNDFMVKAAALTLREFPNLNASLDGDQVVRHGAINIGVAVAVDDGLLTVVLRDADLKPLQVLSQETRPMVERARQGRVRPEDIEGSTFTVSNLGMFDVENFIAIINPPEAAILAVGSVLEVPVVKDGALAIGQRLKVTLAADHRVTDGAEAARWLQAFKAYLEQPLRLLL